jgi:hypothetical protein
MALSVPHWQPAVPFHYLSGPQSLKGITDATDETTTMELIMHGKSRQQTGCILSLIASELIAHKEPGTVAKYVNCS